MDPANAAGSPYDSLVLMALLIWPGIILGAALLNMFISWTFSWSELVIDFFIGILIGMSFFYGTDTDPSGVADFFLVVSHGLIGLLKVAGVDSLADPETFFAWSAVMIGVATVLSAAFDHLSAVAGTGVGGVILSIFMFPLKAPFALISSGIGVLIGIIGLIYRAAATSKKGSGFALGGGVLFFEWGNSGLWATTFGSAVNVFQSTIARVLPHELYHTRQYIYMHDWLGVFYFTVGALWGIFSSAIEASASSATFDASYAFRADASGGKEVGNPIEIAAWRRYP